MLCFFQRRRGMGKSWFWLNYSTIFTACKRLNTNLLILTCNFGIALKTFEWKKKQLLSWSSIRLNVLAQEICCSIRFRTTVNWTFNINLPGLNTKRWCIINEILIFCCYYPDLTLTLSSYNYTAYKRTPLWCELYFNLVERH